MPSFEEKLSHDRHLYLKDLRSKVYDVDSGTGINFEFYNESAEVMAIEPALDLLNKSKAKIKKQIELINGPVHRWTHRTQ
ncbi:MAG: hypothetical protein ACI9O4_000759 [Chitinophagales bacterium]|jgi:hypothetical protein